MHFVAPERPYTRISTPTARDNEEASTERGLLGGSERRTPVGPSSQRAAHGDIIDIREEQKGGRLRVVAVARGKSEEKIASEGRRERHEKKKDEGPPRSCGNRQLAETLAKAT